MFHDSLVETSNRHRGGSRSLKANLLERRRHQGQRSVIKEAEARLKPAEQRLERDDDSRAADDDARAADDDSNAGQKLVERKRRKLNSLLIPPTVSLVKTLYIA